MSIVQVNGKVLIWAREQRRLTREQASERLEISIDELIAYEENRDSPNIGFLKKMASKYKVPDATLAMPSVPPPISPLKDFRTIRNIPAKISFETAIAIDNTRFFSDCVDDLLEESPDLFKSPVISKVSSREDLINSAVNERTRFGLDNSTQIEWTNQLDAFRYLRRKMESFGIIIYLLKMGDLQDCRGFSISNKDSYPIIVINDKEEQYSPKIYTLMHEYAHLMLRDSGICNENPRNQIEKACNRFAAEFLMPIGVIAKILELPTDRKVKEFDEQEIIRASRKLKVSQESLVIRLQELKLAPANFHDTFLEWVRNRSEPKKRGGGISTQAEQGIRRLGMTYPKLVFRALDRKKITNVDAFKMLRVRPKWFSEMKTLLSY